MNSFVFLRCAFAFDICRCFALVVVLCPVDPNGRFTDEVVDFKGEHVKVRCVQVFRYFEKSMHGLRQMFLREAYVTLRTRLSISYKNSQWN